MRLMFLVALTLAGCSYGPKTVTQSDTAITIAASPGKQQQVEDIAMAHCRRSGLVPRLAMTSGYAPPDFLDVVPAYRFECQPRPTR